MRRLTGFLTVLTMCYCQAFAGPTGQGLPIGLRNNYKRIIIKAAAHVAVKKIRHRMNYWNANRGNPALFSENLKSNKDQKYFLALWKLSGLKELPKINHKNGMFYIEIRENRISFDTNSIYKQTIFFNGRPFSWKESDSFETTVERWQTFSEQKIITNFNPWNLVIDEAHAIFWLPVIAVVGAATLVGIGGFKAYQALAGDDEGFEDLQEMRKYIQQKIASCREHLEKVEEHSGSGKTYFQSTPGSFSTFGELEKYFDDNFRLDEQKLENELYRTIGNDKVKNCSDFADKLKSKESLIGSRQSTIEMAASGQDLSTIICNEHAAYVACLEDYYKIHQSHIDRDGTGKINVNIDLYDSEKGVYDYDHYYKNQDKGK